MRDSDDDLISRYLQGNMAAFERLYERYAPRLLGFLIATGAGRDAAEDLAQKTWLRAIESLARYEPRDRFRPWLFKTAHHLWLDERRSVWERKRLSLEEIGEKEGEETALAGSAPEKGVSPFDQAAARQERELVNQALDELPEELRRTVLLRVDADLTHREIAEEMECPIGTVLWRMHEAQRRLSERLGLGTRDRRAPARQGETKGK